MKLQFSATGTLSLILLSYLPGRFPCCDAFLSPKATLRLSKETPAADSSNEILILKPSHRLFARQDSHTHEPLTSWLQRTAVSTAFAVSVLATPLSIQLDSSALLARVSCSMPSVRFERTEASALTEEQLMVTDVWKEVTRQYLDTTYNGMGEEKWKAKKLETVKKVTNFGPDDQEQVYAAIREMLSSLGDPYTRFLTPAQYEALATYARGDSAGVGVQLQVDPTSGNVVVLNTVPGGPAEKDGGVQPGDAILEVDGMDVRTAPAEVVAAQCRGSSGTQVSIAIRPADGSKVRYLTLERAVIKVNPVQTAVASIKGRKYGVLQLPSFSQETTKQVVDGLRNLQKKDKLDALVLDIRGNAGGYMPAGVDVAKLFLPPSVRIITQVDKSDRKVIDIADGIGSETQLPLYILVDGRTASASEIMTAGLQDNGRAIVLGNGKTFGKGRIQNVQQVGGSGSGVAVTKAKYITPSGRDVHGVGILPDIRSSSCDSDNTVSDCIAAAL